MDQSAQPESGHSAPSTQRPAPYVPAIGRSLRILLYLIFASVALLGATGIYLTAVRVMGFYTQFSLWMLLAHIAVGVVLVLPFLVFGLTHLITVRNRPNRRAVKLGILLFVTCLIVGATGVALLQLDRMPQLRSESFERNTVLYLHILAPIVALVVYILHRRAGPRVRWKWGVGWGIAVVAFTTVMASMHTHDPRTWYQRGSVEGEKYFEPSKTRTTNGKFIAAKAMMMDAYCMKCHEDIYKDHIHSAHKFSSFNNPAYLFSVTETRRRMGVRASRWCAGCHDPVPFFSGQFDDPKYDMLNDPTAHAGITCTVCHSMTNVNSRSGNADYTIEEPVHYPFAYSDNMVLQWVNNQLVKAKPDFHKQTFMKPFLKTETFCSTCHKVGIPQEVNHYKEFLRGQNHADSFLLSGVSGHGVRSWYYPKTAKRCNECHMPLQISDDRGARDFDGSGNLKVHSHLFVGANNGVHALIKKNRYPDHYDPAIPMKRHLAFLRGGVDGKSPALRIDIFGLKHCKSPNDNIEHGVHANLIDDQPLRPNLPKLIPGGIYLVETVVRTLNMGHHFTEGTVDSNEVWIEFTAKSGKRVLGKSGFLIRDDNHRSQRKPIASFRINSPFMSFGVSGRVDPGAHFLNNLVLDRFGNRVDRRNAQDIFTSLYNHQIPPGAAQVVHYRLVVPKDMAPGYPVKITARVRYRKFDHTYMEKVYGKDTAPPLPIIDLCEDEVILPVKGLAESVPSQVSPIQRKWQRWNDYGIGCFLEGKPTEPNELGQAKRSFQRLLSAEFHQWPEAEAHGHLNLARVFLASPGDGGYEKAERHLLQALKVKPQAPWWTVAWFANKLNQQRGQIDLAIDNLRKLLKLQLDQKLKVDSLTKRIREQQLDANRRFDFTKDFVLLNELGALYYTRAQQESGKNADQYLRMAVEQYEKTLQLDPENAVAHEQLHQVLKRLAKYPDDWRPDHIGSHEMARTVRTLAGARSPIPLWDRLGDLVHRQKNDKTTVSKLAGLHRGMWLLARRNDDPWLRLGLSPLIRRVDAQLLRTLSALGRTLADMSRSRSARRTAAEQLLMALQALERQPPSANALPAFAATIVLPRPGLPVNTALTSLASHGHLEGPLLAPRLLELRKLHDSLRPLLNSDHDRSLRAAVTEVLAEIHLIRHGIYTPDVIAPAIRAIYRERHPLADNAANSITIYRLVSEKIR